MTDSTLQFARDFEKLKSGIARFPSTDLALLALLDFWPQLREKQNNKSYASYFDEYIPHLVRLIDNNNLFDLNIEELRALSETISEIDAFLVTDNQSPLEREKMELVALALARLYFYSGSYAEGMAVIAKLIGEEIRIDLTPDEIGDKDELEILRLLCEKIPKESLRLHNILNLILLEWEETREKIRQDQVLCLFVEKDGLGRAYRGRLRALEGNVESFGKSAQTDEITFATQIKTPDDPFVGVAYDALKAVRAVFKRFGPSGKGELFYHAHFSIPGSKDTFTGDSIGLAFALVTYTQLLKPEITRLEKFLPADVAFTGGLDDTGHMTPINDESLKYKIERAFFSPIKYLVIPQQNYDAALSILVSLKSRYPQRYLRLIPAETLAELIDNRNIIRSEKLCIGEFVAKKAYKYTRTAKVQIPLLAILILAALAILFPKYTPWFDWRIDHIEIMGNRFKTINPDGHTIWVSMEFDFALNGNSYSQATENAGQFHIIADIDDDGEDELFFVPYYFAANKSSTELQFYDGNDIPEWTKPTYEPTGYPGDTSIMGYDKNLDYLTFGIFPVLNQLKELRILTMAVASFPARTQFLLFDRNGEKIAGPYLNAGDPTLDVISVENLNGEAEPKIYISCVNNRMNRACLLVLDPMLMYGISPPYDNELFLASHMQKGSQLYYVGFPETELSSRPDIRNQIATNRRITGNCRLVVVDEGNGLNINGKEIRRTNAIMPPSIEYILDSNLLPISAYFPDLSLGKFQELLAQIKAPQISNPTDFLNKMKDDIIVYHGDSIVYHVSKDIHFNSNK
jgi:hypothetical protein